MKFGACVQTGGIVYYINIFVFLTAISIRIGLLSSKIHNGDGTRKDFS